MKTLVAEILLVVSAAAQTFPVAGVAIDGARNAPLERARVILADEGGGRQSMVTGSGGRFAFAVPEGTYTLSAERNEWRVVYGHPDPSEGFGSAVIAGAGKDTAHLVLRWHPPGAIFGRVIDDQDEPVRGATIQLLRDEVFLGRRHVLHEEWATSDDRGEYRLAPLTAGTYYVVATGRPWYAGEEASPNGAMVYPATYYPGTTDMHGASPLALASGGEVEADIRLRATSGAHLHIRCPGSGLEADRCPGFVSVHAQSFDGIGIYEESADGVPPGRYTLTLNGNNQWARKVVDVGSGDQTVDLTLKPAPVITGKVTFKNGPPKRGATLYVSLVDETTKEEVDAAVDSGGAFDFADTGGSRFRLSLYGSAGMFIARMSAAGAPLQDDVLDLTEETVAHLDILASDETGRVKGFAMAGDSPAPEVMVVLAARDGHSQPRGYQTESDGSFDYTQIPAGDYLLFAVNKLGIEYATAEVIRPYLATATAVHVPAHGAVEQRVQVAAGTGN